MKKILLAVLLGLASLANAQGIQTYGNLTTFTERSTTGTATTTQMTNDQSRIGFRGVEKVGNANAFFKLETSIISDDPRAKTTSLGDRAAVVGLRNKLGSIGLGRDVHAYGFYQSVYSPMGVNYGMEHETVREGHGGPRFGNAHFIAVTPMPGVSIRYDRSLDETGKLGATTSMWADAKLGMLRVGYTEHSSPVTGDTKALGVIATVSKNLELIGLTVQDRKPTNKGDSYTVGAKVALASQWDAAVGMGEFDRATDHGKFYNAKLTYKFSNRTNAQLAIFDASSNVKSFERKQVGLGLSHAF